MPRLGKPISIKLSSSQEAFLKNLSQKKNKSFSEIIRDLVDEKMDSVYDQKKADYAATFSIKTYHLLKQLLIEYHENSSNTLDKAESISEAVIDTIGA